MGPLESIQASTKQGESVGIGTGSRPPRKRSSRLRKLDLAILLVLVVLLALSATPWPSAMLIRSVFERGAQATIDEMTPYVPDTPLQSEMGVVYKPGSTFDVFSPAGTTAPLPAVVWIHGGAWISGAQRDVNPYLQILAAEGYTTIGLSYPIAPEATYPTAVRDINDALAYIKAHAAELNVDTSRIVLAGDSAGGQLASQMATLTVNPEYANLMGITPALQKSELAATILHCGVYDLRAMADLSGIVAWGFKTSLWAYTGTKDWSATYAGATMSTIDFVTADLPPTFISGGNGDGLTWLQSVPYSNRLKEAGVPVTELFWPANHEPELPHEYQFHLNFDEAREARDRTFDFLSTHAARR
ncbi:alpha/beta hydrolase [Paenarthrobacter nitroguajacolicus]|uniref:Alpha/beta hydrolase n=1 Tax=Paenarthrobacter nitroguajacolicus TaxID=211146 RepID=A0A558H6I4_PAENT|nr:alpha/beta hydrolase [Paenarthrobacter nitroguajacolicus]TVU64691.1 alpha/beta hydrolase [Paenarthrobacter nitroguajacolicus]